jgi:SAM-dependent methyltransferase
MRRDAGLRHFERLYAASDDPWNCRESAYERAKFADTLAHLPRPRYRRALEVGCSIGVLTDHLATRADRVLGIDASPRAIRLARAGRRRAGVAFRRARVPAEWPAGGFDLCVLSEVLYYLTPQERRQLTARLARAAVVDVVLVNWRGATGTPWSGDEAAADIVRRARHRGFVAATTARPDYRVDVLRRAAGDGTRRLVPGWDRQRGNAASFADEIHLHGDDGCDI